jgi:hypothetical protein
MPSVGEKKRSQRAKTVARAISIRAERENPAAPPAPPKKLVTAGFGQGARETGLGWLLAKKRISPAQGKAGARYGELFRAATIGGGQSLRSCLNDSVGGEGKRSAAEAAEINMAWISDASAALTAARAAVGFHSDMIASLDLICGHGIRPRDISQLTREVDQIETVLRVALDMLGDHFRQVDRRRRD